MSFSKPLVALLSLTGLIHLGIGIATTLQSVEFLNVLVLLNGLGYFVLGYLQTNNISPLDDSQLRLLTMGYTIVTIIAYFVSFGLEGLTSVVGMIAKLTEVAIVVLLVQANK